jgi:hypothetical protein
MKKDRVSEVIKELEMGFIPTEFIFNLDPVVEIDWLALKYNDWTELDYWAQKIPDGLLEQFPCLESWVESIWEDNKNITPLMELEYRKNNI